MLAVSGVAAWVSERGEGEPRVLVLGAEKDFIVDRAGVQETGRYFGVAPLMLPGLHHDVMLGAAATSTAALVADLLARDAD